MDKRENAGPQASNESDSLSVRVLIFREGEAYIAQCLEYDISAFAPDKETLLNRFVNVFGMEMNISLDRGGAPFAGVAPAPQQFHDMWKQPTVELSSSVTYGNARMTMAEAA